MPARTDHDRRDAQHAARARIAVAMGRYVRRLTEEAYAHIELEATNHDGDGYIDWSKVGTDSADRALGAYGILDPAPALEAEHAAITVGPGGAYDETRS